MLTRRFFAALAIATLSLVPTLASAAMTEKWHTTGSGYDVISVIGDIDGDGVFDMITGELDAGGEKIAIRSAATGAIEALTVAAYQPSNFNFADIDGDGDLEIIFLDNVTFKLTCLDYTTGSSTLAVRWAFIPLPGLASTWFFADLDGNGHLYLVFSEVGPGAGHNYEVRNRNGALFATFNPTGPGSSSVNESNTAADYDNDGRQELMLTFREGFPSTALNRIIYVFENSAPPVSVESGDQGPQRSIALGSSFPNPTSRESRIEYSVPSSGRASLRLFDTMGREVRTLVDGTVQAGRHEAIWHGRDTNGRAMPAGAYFYEFNANGESVGRRIVRLH